jgi:deoxyribodipyrimidine photolyase-like uncharacterized protein
VSATLRLVLGDQLDQAGAALAGLDAACDTVLMVEAMAEATYVPHHPKKIAFILAAMRHFAAELREAGVRVRYITLDDPANRQSFAGELDRAVAELARRAYWSPSPASGVSARSCGAGPSAPAGHSRFCRTVASSAARRISPAGRRGGGSRG